MTRRIRKAAATAVHCTSLAICACSAGPTDTEAARELQQPSTAFLSYDADDYWQPAETIEVCFFGPASTTASRDSLADALEEQDWGGLTIDARNTCTSSSSSSAVRVYVTDAATPRVGPYSGWATATKGNRIVVPLVVDDLNGGTVDIAPNFDNRTDVQVWMIWSGTFSEIYQRTIVHEMLHVIGIGHEHDRVDAPDCSVDPSHRSYNLLTEYDPTSIMSYCAVANGRDSLDYYMTALDALGVEILYPKGPDLPIRCKAGCIDTADGVILRTDGRARDDWTFRGGLEWWTASLPWWRTGTSSTVGSGVLDASSLGTGTHAVTYGETATVSGRFVQGSGQVVVSNSKWTGVISAVL